MKKIFTALVLLTALIVFSGCSKDGVSVAKYSDGKKTYQVRIGDFKNEILPYVSYNPMIVGDTNWHKEFLFGQFILPNIILFEEKGQGLLTNQKYLDAYNVESEKIVLVKLYSNGVVLLKDQSQKEKYDTVRASHILVLASKMTNINGKTQEMKPADYAKLLADKEIIAKNILDSLKASKSLDKDFSNIAIQKSEDPGSAVAGGDLGYFFKGFMVKEFEDAAFGATKKGLLDNIVKTDYGFHIIYVTAPSQKKSLSDIENLLGKQKFQQYEPNFMNVFMGALIKDQVKENYSVDVVSNTIISEGKGYTVANLPETAKLFTVYGNPYTWKDVKKILTLFNAQFELMAATGLFTTDQFDKNVKALENNLMIVEVAKKNNVQKSGSFLKDVDKTKLDLQKQIAAQFMSMDINKQINDQVTPDMISAQYKQNRAAYTNMVNGRVVQLSQKEAEAVIRQQLGKAVFEKYFADWRNKMTAKYKIEFDANGLKSLQDLETDQIKKDQNQKQNAPKTK